MKSDYQRQSERCRRILRETVVDFFLPDCLDNVNGGYLEDREDGVFVPSPEKFVLLQARQAWVFSLIADQDIEKSACLEAAQTGLDYLEKYMRDPKHGGYYATVSDSGEPADTRKHVCLNVFVLYALARNYMVTEDPSVLAKAQDLFALLERHAYDQTGGGYVEFFTEDWTPILDRNAHNYFSTTGTKTLNTHLHIVETYAELYRVWPDPVLKARIEELVEMVFNKFRHPLYSRNINAWTPDWKYVLKRHNFRANYGHDMESVWFAMDACESTGVSFEPYFPRAKAIFNYCLKRGYDRRHGGFYSQGPLAGIGQVRDKVWWVQAESLVAMLMMFKKTADHVYYQTFEDTLDFIERHQITADGGWLEILHANGTPKVRRCASRWQGGYHTARSMILSSNMLDELASGAS